MSSECSADFSRSIGQFKKRHRWKLDDPYCPCDRALPDHIPDSTGFFPEVPAEIMDFTGWHHRLTLLDDVTGSSIRPELQ
eukprot:1231601-Amphidinium_carterae.1